MKIYTGERLQEGCEVYVIEDGKRRPLALRLDLRNHSPDGFEWGYGGSGPAQLALAILADCLGENTPPEECPFCGSKMNGWKCSVTNPEACAYDGTKEGDSYATVRRLYQSFKSKIVAALAPKWEIDEAAIRRVVAGLEEET